MFINNFNSFDDINKKNDNSMKNENNSGFYRAFVEVVIGNRKMSNFIASAGLGITGAGVCEVFTIDYKKGEEVSGVIIKYNKHGALASIEEGVAGLVHISEFESEEKLRTTLEIGKSYSFKINIFEPESQKMTLSPIL